MHLPWHKSVSLLPVSTVEKFGWHAVQFIAPATSLYEPISQGIHWVVSEAFGYSPGGHSTGKQIIHNINFAKGIEKSINQDRPKGERDLFVIQHLLKRVTPFWKLTFTVWFHCASSRRCCIVAVTHFTLIRCIDWTEVSHLTVYTLTGVCQVRILSRWANG